MSRSPLFAAFFFCFFSSDTHATEKESPEQKQARAVLLQEFPLHVEPQLENADQKIYWHKLLLNGAALNFHKISVQKYQKELSEVQSFEKPLYVSAYPLNRTESIWRITITEPPPMPIDSPFLIVCIGSNSKKVVAAWIVSGG